MTETWTIKDRFIFMINWLNDRKLINDELKFKNFVKNQPPKISYPYVLKIYEKEKRKDDYQYYLELESEKKKWREEELQFTRDLMNHLFKFYKGDKPAISKAIREDYLPFFNDDEKKKIAKDFYSKKFS